MRVYEKSCQIRFLKLFLGLLMAGSIIWPAMAADILAGSEWGPGQAERQFIRFENDGKVAGNGGCNRLFGSYEISGTNSILIGPLASTRMACPPTIMEKETAFISALENVRKFKRETGKLILFDDERVRLVTLLHRDWD